MFPVWLWLSPHSIILLLHQRDVTFKKKKKEGGGGGVLGCLGAVLMDKLVPTAPAQPMRPHWFHTTFALVHFNTPLGLEKKGADAIAFWVMFVSLPCLKVSDDNNNN